VFVHAGVSDGPQLPSERVAAALRLRIAGGEWEPRQRMPSVAELADAYDTSRATVTKALRKLSAEGLVTIVPNWGTFREEE
jgi:DNA-binding GntR family transcriptional regulator